MNDVMARQALTAGQYRAARAMLGWSVIEASRHADVSPVAVLSLEKGLNITPERSREALAAAYEAAGIGFHGSIIEGVGLLFRPSTIGLSSSIL